MRGLNDCQSSPHRAVPPDRYPSPPCCAEDGDSRVSVDFMGWDIDEVERVLMESEELWMQDIDEIGALINTFIAKTNFHGMDRVNEILLSKMG